MEDKARSLGQIYQDKLGLSIEMLQPNVYKFSFTLIDSENLKKKFSTIIELQGARATVLECFPSVPELNNLSEELAHHGEIYKFLKNLRNAFCKYAKSN